jgi:hypothetical protein
LVDECLYDDLRGIEHRCSPPGSAAVARGHGVVSPSSAAAASIASLSEMCTGVAHKQDWSVADGG